MMLGEKTPLGSSYDLSPLTLGGLYRLVCLKEEMLFTSLDDGFNVRMKVKIAEGDTEGSSRLIVNYFIFSRK